MRKKPASRRMLISYAAYFLIFAAAAARAIFSMGSRGNLGLLVGLLAGYLILLIIEPLLLRRSIAFLHVLNTLQVTIGLILLLYVNRLDFFSLLFIPPCMQSVLHFQRKTALTWIGVICLLMISALLLRFPRSESIGYVIIYPAAIFLFSSFGYLILQAEQAQSRSEALLADLQKANLKLQAYAAQVQELAAADERNRLARELHDSVTQIIFGLTLSAQAARILFDRDPSRVPAQLDQLQTLAQEALAEMRALIQQLHPRSIADEGLAAALRRLSSQQSANNSLIVDLNIRGERHLPSKVEAELFHIAQEALINIVKHAHTDHAVITLNTEDPGQICMQIDDDGVGFDPNAARSAPGHLGLISMDERIRALGGRLEIASKPGKGTSVRIELKLMQEADHA